MKKFYKIGKCDYLVTRKDYIKYLYKLQDFEESIINMDMVQDYFDLEFVN